MNLEEKIFTIISYGGDAKAIAYEALKLAYENKYFEAEEKLKEANHTLIKAHNTQTKLIQAQIQGKKIEMSLLLVHAQDHLMTAISEMTLIEQIISLSKRICKLEEKVME